jgi:hypothetical protein
MILRHPTLVRYGTPTLVRYGSWYGSVGASSEVSQFGRMMALLSGYPLSRYSVLDLACVGLLIHCPVHRHDLVFAGGHGIFI